MFALTAAVPARAQTEPKPGWAFDGLALRNEQQDFRLQLVGYGQADVRSFPDWNVSDETIHNPSNDFPRRLRVGIDGRWKRLAWEVEVDPSNDGNEHLKNAYGELRFGRSVRLRGGNFKVPVAREWLTSASKIDFIERSMAVDTLAPSRDWGAMVHGEVHHRLLYQVGVFKGDGRSDPTRAETTGAARVVVTPIRALDIGGSYSQGQVKAAPESELVAPAPNGVHGVTPSGFRFYVRHFVNGTRRRIGLESVLKWAGLALKGEWLRHQDQRKGQGSVFDDLPDAVGTGWAASVVWTTKKKKVETEEEGEVSTRSWYKGPLEVAARYESLRFDDNGPSTGFAGAGNRARNIRPVQANAFTGGVSWWVGKWARLMGNVILERYDDPLITPVPNRKGNYVTLLGRLQFQLP
ncbi:MAG TPA: porin [Vicinamibacteria bacterium]